MLMMRQYFMMTPFPPPPPCRFIRYTSSTPHTHIAKSKSQAAIQSHNFFVIIKKKVFVCIYRWLLLSFTINVREIDAKKIRCHINMASMSNKR